MTTKYKLRTKLTLEVESEINAKDERTARAEFYRRVSLTLDRMADEADLLLSVTDMYHDATEVEKL